LYSFCGNNFSDSKNAPIFTYDTVSKKINVKLCTGGYKLELGGGL